MDPSMIIIVDKRILTRTQVPRLGPAPKPDGTPVFKSLIAYDGSPLEYSWKWNTTTGEPNIRYSWEAIGKDSGTASDPLNHDPTLDYMKKVTQVIPAADYSWYRHFLAEIYRPDRGFYAKELEAGEPPATILMHAVESNKKASFGLKAYFLARKLFMGGGPRTMQEWDDAIMKAQLWRRPPRQRCTDAFPDHQPRGQADEAQRHGHGQRGAIQVPP